MSEQWQNSLINCKKTFVFFPITRKSYKICQSTERKYREIHQTMMDKKLHIKFTDHSGEKKESKLMLIKAKISQYCDIG